jgi:hypothetical protein
MKYHSPVEVPAALITWMRSHASRNAFLADMLRVIDRTGGLTQRQLDMVCAAQCRSLR